MSIDYAKAKKEYEEAEKQTDDFSRGLRKQEWFDANAADLLSTLLAERQKQGTVPADRTARVIVDSFWDDDTRAVYSLQCDGGDKAIKLLTVNSLTIPSPNLTLFQHDGYQCIHVLPVEFEAIKRGTLKLPAGLTLGPQVRGDPNFEWKVWGHCHELYADDKIRVVRCFAVKGGFCSMHLHEYMDNTFIVESGSLFISDDDGSNADAHHLIPITEDAGNQHMFEAYEDTHFIEVYTSTDGKKPSAADIVRFSEGGVK